MGDNIIIDGIMGKIPQAKEAVQKVEEATGKKIEDIANDVGTKIGDAVKGQTGDDPKAVFGNIANKLLHKD